MKRLAVLLLFMTVLNCGCASAPQKVAINPVLSVKASGAGRGQEIWTDVVDARPRPTIGTLDSLGIKTELIVEGDLRTAVRDSVADGLRLQGFTPVDAPPKDVRELRVEIQNLEYTVTTNFWAHTLRTECALKAACILGNRRPYENTYHGKFQDSLLVIQSEEANKTYINAVVSRAVNALLQDPQLLHCLASPKQP